MYSKPSSYLSSSASSSASSPQDPSSHDSHWTCPSCTLLNKGTNQRCDVCFSLRPTPTPIIPTPSSSTLTTRSSSTPTPTPSSSPSSITPMEEAKTKLRPKVTVPSLPDLIATRLQKVQEWGPTNSQWPSLLPPTVHQAYKRHWSKVLPEFKNPDLFQMIITDNGLVAYHYLRGDGKTQPLKIESEFQADATSWERKPLDLDDRGYGWSISPSGDSQELLVQSNSMKEGPFRLHKKQGIARAEYTDLGYAGPRHLLIALIFSSPIQCRAYGIFDVGGVHKGAPFSVSFLNWFGPKIAGGGGGFFGLNL